MDIFQASISMWSKVSDSTVNNQIAYFMTQSASLQLLDLPSFSQDTKVDTKVRSTQFCNWSIAHELSCRLAWIYSIMWTLVEKKSKLVSEWLNRKSLSTKKPFPNGPRRRPHQEQNLSYMVEPCFWMTKIMSFATNCFLKNKLPYQRISSKDVWLILMLWWFRAINKLKFALNQNCMYSIQGVNP